MSDWMFSWLRATGHPGSQILLQDLSSQVFLWTQDKHSPCRYQKFIGGENTDLVYSVSRGVETDECLYSFTDVSCAAVRCGLALCDSLVSALFLRFCSYSPGHRGRGRFQSSKRKTEKLKWAELRTHICIKICLNLIDIVCRWLGKSFTSY